VQRPLKKPKIHSTRPEILLLTWNINVHHRAHNSPPFHRTLSHMDPVQTHTSLLFIYPTYLSKLFTCFQPRPKSPTCPTRHIKLSHFPATCCRFCLFSKTCMPILLSTQSPVERLSPVLSPGLKRPGVKLIPDVFLARLKVMKFYLHSSIQLHSRRSNELRVSIKCRILT
jgi:hypothetical protein